MDVKSLLKGAVIALPTIALGTSCASIVSRSRYEVTINSIPSESIVRVLNRRGTEVAAGQTPVTLQLKASDGFFRSARYTIVFSKDGYEDKHVPLEANIDPWYFGNLIFGSLLGFLIVDPATGAMWKIEDTMVSATLSPKAQPIATAKVEGSEHEVKVYALADIPAELQERMTPIQAQ